MSANLDAPRLLQPFQRENLTLRGVLVCVLIAAVALVVMAQSRPTRTVEAEAFVLRGPDGSTKAKLDTSDGTTQLLFYSASGQPRMAVKLDEQGEGIEMRDDSGELMALVSVAVRKTESPERASPTTATIAVLGRLAGPAVIMNATKEGAIVRVGDKGHTVWAASSDAGEQHPSHPHVQ